MRLICPHCRLSVTVADTAAGRITQCPSCDQPITVPALTGAAIDAAPEPLASSRPATNPAAAASRERERPDEPVRSQRPSASPPDTAKIAGLGAPWLRLTLRRDVAHWLAPAALVVVFVLTFFTWVAIAPNGNRIYTQNAWQAAGGGFSTDLGGEAVMVAETDLRANSHWNPWLMFFLILLIPTVPLAIADRVLARNPAMIPEVIRPAWPYRQLIIAGLCAVLLLFLIAPLTFGFGLESAVAEAAEKAVVLPPSTAEPTTKEKAERDVKRDLFIARFGLHRTGWLYLALAAQAIALAGAGLSRWLDRHPDAPDPRVEVYC
jgi:hypothetical protein